jgi:DNA-binding response OmpR family regulator
MGEDIHLAIVDDHLELVESLQDAFELEGYTVLPFLDALPMIRYVKKNGLPHLALIDLNLPYMHGFELSRELKKFGDIPIIFISGEKETKTVVDGLSSYADDYVIKPFEIEELVARVRRVLSRIPNFHYVYAPVIDVDEWLSVELGRGKLRVGDRHILLTPTESGLLGVLIRNAGTVVTAETLISRVWPTEDAYIFEETLRVHMHRLRRKLEPDLRQPKYIITERGVGYRFIALETPIQS